MPIRRLDDRQRRRCRIWPWAFVARERRHIVEAANSLPAVTNSWRRRSSSGVPHVGKASRLRFGKACRPVITTGERCIYKRPIPGNRHYRASMPKANTRPYEIRKIVDRVGSGRFVRRRIDFRDQYARNSRELSPGVYATPSPRVVSSTGSKGISITSPAARCGR